MSHSFITDPRVQQFVDDAALGAKVRALLPTPTILDEQKAAMLRTSVAELEALVTDAESRANDLANALAKMTAERDALVPKLREVSFALNNVYRGYAIHRNDRVNAAIRIAAESLTPAPEGAQP